MSGRVNDSFSSRYVAASAKYYFQASYFLFGRPMKRSPPTLRPKSFQSCIRLNVLQFAVNKCQWLSVLQKLSKKVRIMSFIETVYCSQLDRNKAELFPVGLLSPLQGRNSRGDQCNRDRTQIFRYHNPIPTRGGRFYPSIAEVAPKIPVVTSLP